MPRDPIFLTLRKHCLDRGWSFKEISRASEDAFLDRAPFVSGEGNPRVWIAKISSTFIGQAHNARVFGDGFLYVDGELILHGITHHNELAQICRALSPHMPNGEPPHPVPENGEIEEAVLCWGTQNFGHWLFTHLHRLTLLWHKPELLTKPILVKTGTPHRFVEWLRRMGFENIVYGGDWVLVKKLWVPSVVQYRGHNGEPHFYPEAVHAFRHLVLRDWALPSGRRTRIFISRRNARWRRILNEAELGEALLKRGIETALMDEMTLEEQLRLVSQAELIVVSAGGDSPITMLAPRDCRVVELSPPALKALFGSRYWARLLGQAFYRVEGVPVKGSHASSMDEDYTVNVNEVLHVIDAKPVRHER